MASSASTGRSSRDPRGDGAAEAHAARTGLQRDATDEAFLAPLIRQARSALPNGKFDAAEAAGRALGLDEALAEARVWLSASAQQVPKAATG